MRPAPAPRPHRDLRLVVVDAARGDFALDGAAALARHLRAGDVVVVNDAATLPASLPALDPPGLELRLVSHQRGGQFRVLLFGDGDWRTRTEDRAPPPVLPPGSRIAFAGELRAEITRTLGAAGAPARFADARFFIEDGGRDHQRGQAALWGAIYRAGRPIQYAHVPEPLALWEVQNGWAARPWAVEQPSAGRMLGIGDLLSLRRAGVTVVAVTEAAGISSTGDLALDAALPAPERWEVPAVTVRALQERPRGARVVAVGTSVVRALESAARVAVAPVAHGAGAAQAGQVTAAAGVTDLRLGPGTPLLVTGGLLTGLHDEGTSHFALLEAFCGAPLLRRAWAAAEAAGFLGHELGDAALVLR